MPRPLLLRAAIGRLNLRAPRFSDPREENLGFRGCPCSRSLPRAWCCQAARAEHPSAVCLTHYGCITIVALCSRAACRSSHVCSCDRAGGSRRPFPKRFEDQSAMPCTKHNAGKSRVSAKVLKRSVAAVSWKLSRISTGTPIGPCTQFAARGDLRAPCLSEEIQEGQRDAEADH